MVARKSRGQSVVEFALTMPVFLLLVMGIVDLGRGVACYNLLANCAREGARAGTIPQTTDATIMAAVDGQSLFLGKVSTGQISMAITPASAGSRTSGANIKVQLSYTFVPIIGSMLTNTQGPVMSLSSLSMTAQSTMLIE